MAKVVYTTVEDVPFKELREECGISMADLSLLTGFHITHLYKWQSGRRRMDEKTWQNIDIIFNLPPSILKRKLKKLKK